MELQVYLNENLLSLKIGALQKNYSTKFGAIQDFLWHKLPYIPAVYGE